MSQKSEIPFGAQFSPNQVDLKRLLEIIHQYAGDRDRITEEIRQTFFADKSPEQNWKLADNVVLAMRAYGLLGEDAAQPTEFANYLLSISGDEKKLYWEFAKHILFNLKGLIYIETIQTMQTAGENITLHTLRKNLEQRGVHVPRGAVHLSSLRLWLAKAGVFDPEVSRPPRIYEVNEIRLQQITGIGLDEIDRLTDLDYAQRSFLRALIRITEEDPLIANKVADLADGLYNAEYDHKKLPSAVLLPLQSLGYIHIEKSTAGRGAKPYEVYRTEKFRSEISDPILDAAAERAELVPRELFEKPLAEILKELKSPDTYVKGKALELLAIYFSRLLDLEFKGWRVRSEETGGAEVDVIVEGARLIFSRWQIQAKNTKRVRLDDVAKEVGLAITFLYSNVVMVVTTGDFTGDAYSYADYVMKTSNLNVILLTGSDLRTVSEDPTNIVHLLRRKAERAMKIKERPDYNL